MTKVLVSIEDRLLAKVDRAAGALRLSRSAYLSRLAEQALSANEGPGKSESVRRAIEELQRLFDEHPIDDPVKAIREDRDSHW